MYPMGQEPWGQLRILTTTNINDDCNGIFVSTIFGLWFQGFPLGPLTYNCLQGSESLNDQNFMFACVLWTLFETTQVTQENGKVERNSESLMVRKPMTSQNAF